MQFPARNLDVYMGRPWKRVEVLEGPQGTLFGGGRRSGRGPLHHETKPKLDAVFRRCRGQLWRHGRRPILTALVHATLNIAGYPGRAGSARSDLQRFTAAATIDNVPSTFTRQKTRTWERFLHRSRSNFRVPTGVVPQTACPQLPAIAYRATGPGRKQTLPFARPRPESG